MLKDRRLRPVVQRAGLDQVPGRSEIWKTGSPYLCRAVHERHYHRLATVVLPQDVGLAVAVEVSDCLDMPGRSEIWKTGSPYLYRAVHERHHRLATVALPQD